jgi:hypothetical protein
MVRVEFLAGASSRLDEDDAEWRLWSTRKVNVPISVLSEPGCSVSTNKVFPVEITDSMRENKTPFEGLQATNLPLFCLPLFA